MHCSLVIASLGRTQEIRRLFASLAAQTFQDFEAILVDQNDDDRLAPIVQEFSAQFQIVHVRSPKGLSRARNVGMQSVSGSIVAFPDDDCWYPETLFAEVALLLNQHADWDGVTGRAYDPVADVPFGKWSSRPSRVSKENVFRTAISFCIFVRRAVIDRVGSFDETLGVGAETPWGSGEETDYLLRALEAGFTFQYLPAIIAYHPAKTLGFDDSARLRVRTYGRGMGRVVRMHRFSPLATAGFIVRPAAGAALAVLRGNLAATRYYVASALGRLEGYVAARPRC